MEQIHVYRPRGIPFESVRVAKLETDSQSWKTLDSDGARVSNSTGWSRILQLSHNRRKAHLRGTLETRHATRHQTTIHASPQPTTESKRAVKQLIRYLKGTQHTCLRLEPRDVVQTGLLELVGRGDSDWAGGSATRQSVTGYHCDVQNVTMCNRSLKQTAISLSSCEAEFYAASACAGELLGLAELFKELHYDVAVRLEMDPDSARHIMQRRGPGGLKHIEIRCLAIQQWIREKRLSVSRVDTKNNTTDLFTKHFDGLRTRALAKKLGLRFLDMAGGTNVGTADGGTNEKDR